jgi:hypothetical protein
MPLTYEVALDASFVVVCVRAIQSICMRRMPEKEHRSAVSPIVPICPKPGVTGTLAL